MLRMTQLVWLPVLGALLLALACGGGGADRADRKTVTASPRESPTAAASPPSESCPVIDGKVVQGVVAVLETEKTAFSAGEPVKMTMKLINCADKPIKRVYPSEQRYDFSVAAVGGEEVWRWSEGKTFAATKSEVTLQTGQAVTAVETWEQVDNDGKPVAAGSYEITAQSTACDESMQNCETLATHVIEITAQ